MATVPTITPDMTAAQRAAVYVSRLETAAKSGPLSPTQAAELARYRTVARPAITPDMTAQQRASTYVSRLEAAAVTGPLSPTQAAELARYREVAARPAMVTGGPGGTPTPVSAAPPVSYPAPIYATGPYPSPDAYPTGPIGSPSELLAAITKAAAAGYGQVKLPTGEYWGTNPETIAQIRSNIANPPPVGAGRPGREESAFTWPISPAPIIDHAAPSLITTPLPSSPITPGPEVASPSLPFGAADSLAGPISIGSAGGGAGGGGGEAPVIPRGMSGPGGGPGVIDLALLALAAVSAFGLMAKRKAKR